MLAQPSPSLPNTIILRHPSEPLELVLPRGSLADLLLRLGYTEVTLEAADLPTTLLTQEKENSDE